MKWIEFTEDRGTFKKGQRIQKEDAAADTLIEMSVAKACEAPAAEADDAAKGALGDVINAAVTKGFADLRKELAPVTKRFAETQDDDEHTYVLGTAKAFKLPANVKRYGSMRNFKGTSVDGRAPEQRAYEFGMWILGMVGNPKGVEFCKTKGMGFVEDRGEAAIKTSRENSNASSAFLVPDQFENDLIDLREEYGVFRNFARIVPMASDTRSDPRRTGGLTTYFVGESTAPTSSDKTWDRVRLTAKKAGVLTKYSNELNEDAVINVGDDLAGEIAYAFATLEDNCGFNGDGTSTYGKIVGLRSAITNVASNAGKVTAASTGAWSSLVLADFNNVVGKLPQYAFKRGRVGWFVSQAFWGTVMQKLALAAGGNTAVNIVNGVPVMNFLGYPVNIAQQMPTSTAATQICALFGALELGCRFGDRRKTSIRVSDVALNSFEQDEVAVVGFERFDIVCHDVGSATTAGPIIGLST